MSKLLIEFLNKKYPSDNENIIEIIIDSFQIKEFSTSDKIYLEQFKKTQIFSLNNTKLTSLNNLPNFEILSEIDLSDNFIKGEELLKLTKYIHLKKIRLANNNIKHYEDVKCFNCFRNLYFLDLSENPINNISNYKKRIFELIPTLAFLDMQDKEDKNYSEFEEEEDENEDYEDDEKYSESSFIVNDKEEENEDYENEEEEEEEEEEQNEEEHKPNKKRKFN